MMEERKYKEHYTIHMYFLLFAYYLKFRLRRIFHCHFRSIDHFEHNSNNKNMQKMSFEMQGNCYLLNSVLELV